MKSPASQSVQHHLTEWNTLQDFFSKTMNVERDNQNIELYNSLLINSIMCGIVNGYSPLKITSIS
jgi:hypothetical protein